MFCSNCGKELPDDANFCLKCGKPQKEQNPENRIHDNNPPQWETCEIKYELLKSYLYRCRLWAEGKSSKGIYAVTVSDKILKSQYPDGSKGDHASACQQLIKDLLKSGWEPLSEHGNSWYSYRFKRKIK